MHVTIQREIKIQDLIWDDITFYFYACYHTLSAYHSFHAILSYNLKMYYFRDYIHFKNIF